MGCVRVTLFSGTSFTFALFALFSSLNFLSLICSATRISWFPHALEKILTGNKPLLIPKHPVTKIFTSHIFVVDLRWSPVKQLWLTPNSSKHLLPNNARLSPLGPTWCVHPFVQTQNAPPWFCQWELAGFDLTPRWCLEPKRRSQWIL